MRVWRCEKRRRRGLFGRLQRVGGGTLMMPRYGCQQSPSQQAEGTMSASVGAISGAHARQLQVHRSTEEERRRRSCFTRTMTNHLLLYKFCTMNPACFPRSSTGSSVFICLLNSRKGEIFVSNKTAAALWVSHAEGLVCVCV